MGNNELAKNFSCMDIIRFTLPNMVMLVFMSLYTIVDGMFISRYAGEIALSSTNMYYPVMSLQYGIGIMLGTGGSAIVAIKLGSGRVEEAKENFTLITLTAIIIGALFTVICLPFLEQILNMLGTSATQMPHGMAYASAVLWFSPSMFLQMIFQVFFVTAGKPKLGLMLTVLGGILNVILDYIFMGPLSMGIKGAAIATGIGYSVTAVAGLIYFAVNIKGSLYFVKTGLDKLMLLKTCVNGSSEMISNCAIAVTTFLFNIIFMRFWNEEGVAAITILCYFQYVFSAIYMGFSMGVSPVISYKYGADDKKQLKHIVRFSFVFVTLCSISVYVISLITISPSLAIFTDRSGEIFRIAIEGFPIYALQFIFMGLSIFSSALFTSLGNGLISGIISMSRTLVFLVACMLILPELFGELGVWFSVPVAEILGVGISAYFVLSNRKKYKYF